MDSSTFYILLVTILVALITFTLNIYFIYIPVQRIQQRVEITSRDIEETLDLLHEISKDL